MALSEIQQHPLLEDEINQAPIRRTKVVNSRKREPISKINSGQLHLPEKRVFGRGGREISIKTGEVLAPGLVGMNISEEERRRLMRTIADLEKEGKLHK